jgi:predicted metal-dependent phosphoesterase TrpH
MDGYLREGRRTVLLICAEEVHDRTRLPQKNHLLVLGAGREMTTYAANPQNLIDQVQKAGGLAFIAHPKEHALPFLGRPISPGKIGEFKGIPGLKFGTA